MQRFGSNKPSESRKEDGDIFLSRLQLIVVMSKAYLEGLPIGTHRKQAIIDNANTLFYMSLFAEHPVTKPDNRERKVNKESNQFYQKVRLLSVMAKAFAEGRLVGEQKKQELQENMDFICEAITFNSRIKDIGFLNVA